MEDVARSSMGEAKAAEAASSERSMDEADMVKLGVGNETVLFADLMGEVGHLLWSTDDRIYPQM